MTEKGKKYFISVVNYSITKVLELIKFYGECSDTDCETCELGEVCRKTVKLQDSIKNLKRKWEGKNDFSRKK